MMREDNVSVCSPSGRYPIESHNTSTGSMSLLRVPKWLDGVPPQPQPGQDGASPTRTGYAWTGYAVGSMPVTVSHMRTILLKYFSRFIVINRSLVSVQYKKEVIAINFLRLAFNTLCDFKSKNLPLPSPDRYISVTYVFIKLFFSVGWLNELHH